MVYDRTEQTSMSLIEPIPLRVWRYVWAHRRTAAILAAITLIALLAILFTRSCGRTPKLDQQEIIKAQQSIAVEDRKAMQEVLISSDAREAAIDSNVSNAKKDTVNAIADSKEKWSQASDEEIREELLRRLNQ